MFDVLKLTIQYNEKLKIHICKAREITRFVEEHYNWHSILRISNPLILNYTVAKIFIFKQFLRLFTYKYTS